MVWPKLRSGPESDQTTHVSSKLALGCLILSHQPSQLDHNPAPVPSPKLSFSISLFTLFCANRSKLAPGCLILSHQRYQHDHNPSERQFQDYIFITPRSGVVPNQHFCLIISHQPSQLDHNPAPVPIQGLPFPIILFTSQGFVYTDIL